MLRTMVGRGGIEPPTPGFSVGPRGPDMVANSFDKVSAKSLPQVTRQSSMTAAFSFGAERAAQRLPPSSAEQFPF
jgi:hypothetical protein